ncbi:MAG: hypothetical protein ACPGSD_01300 [Flavobacteriales bacterium]
MIITHKHIELYKKIGGDIDHLQRIGTIQESSPFNQKVIIKIGEIISDLELIKNGLTSNIFEKRVNENLNALCEDEKVIEKIKILKFPFK